MNIVVIYTYFFSSALGGAILERVWGQSGDAYIVRSAQKISFLIIAWHETLTNFYTKFKVTVTFKAIPGLHMTETSNLRDTRNIITFIKQRRFEVINTALIPLILIQSYSRMKAPTTHQFRNALVATFCTTIPY